MEKTILGFYLRNEIRTGGHKRYLELLDSLAKKGWKVKVLISNTIDKTQFNFDSIGLKPVFKGKIIPYSLKQMLRILPQLLSLKKGNYITICFGETNYLSMLAANKILKSKSVFAFRSNSYMAKLNQFKLKKITLKKKLQLIKMYRLEKSIVKLSDQLIFQTDFDKNDIIERHKYSKATFIIPNSINESWFLSNYKNINNSSKLKKILYLGSYDERKGAIYLLEAINGIIKSKLNIELDMYGYGPNKKMFSKFINDRGIDDKVTIHDKMVEPIKQIGRYDLMIVPSIYDSYPNVILESIFVGTPVLASKNSGMEAILKYDELLFNTGDSNDIENKILGLLKSQEQYRKIKELCNIRANEHDFIWTDRFENIIDKLEN